MPPNITDNKNHHGKENDIGINIVIHTELIYNPVKNFPFEVESGFLPLL